MGKAMNTAAGMALSTAAMGLVIKVMVSSILVLVTDIDIDI